MNKEPGVVLAGPIWNKFIQKALQKYPSNQSFKTPEQTENKDPILKEEIGLDEKDPQYQNWLAGRENWLASSTIAH